MSPEPHINERLSAAAQPERRTPRVDLDAEVLLRRSMQINYRVRVYDISPQGCLVEFCEAPSLQELLWVKFEGLEALEALVCWTRGPLAGLKFVRPIHPAVFALLLRRLNGD